MLKLYKTVRFILNKNFIQNTSEILKAKYSLFLKLANIYNLRSSLKQI